MDKLSNTLAKLAESQKMMIKSQQLTQRMMLQQQEQTRRLVMDQQQEVRARGSSPEL